MISIPVELSMETTFVLTWVGGILIGILLGFIAYRAFEEDANNED